jgi:hypothetical protein
VIRSRGNTPPDAARQFDALIREIALDQGPQFVPGEKAVDRLNVHGVLSTAAPTALEPSGLSDLTH